MGLIWPLSMAYLRKVLHYQSGTRWRPANPLPGPRSGGKGVTLSGEHQKVVQLYFHSVLTGVVHFVGGAVGFSRLSSILAWDPVSGVNVSIIASEQKSSINSWYFFLELWSEAELQKRADRADQSVLFFLAGANFWEKHAKNRRKQWC